MLLEDHNDREPRFIMQCCGANKRSDKLPGDFALSFGGTEYRGKCPSCGELYPKLEADKLHKIRYDEDDIPHVKPKTRQDALNDPDTSLYTYVWFSCCEEVGISINHTQKTREKLNRAKTCPNCGDDNTAVMMILETEKVVERLKVVDLLR